MHYWTMHCICLTSICTGPDADCILSCIVKTSCIVSALLSLSMFWVFARRCLSTLVHWLRLLVHKTPPVHRTPPVHKTPLCCAGDHEFSIRQHCWPSLLNSYLPSGPYTAAHAASRPGRLPSPVHQLQSCLPNCHPEGGLCGAVSRYLARVLQGGSWCCYSILHLRADEKHAGRTDQCCQSVARSLSLIFMMDVICTRMLN